MAPSVPVQELFRLLRRRRLLIVVTSVFGTSAVAIAATLLPAHYTAKAELVVESRPLESPDSRALVMPPAEDQASVLTEVAKLSARDHLQRVVDSLAHSDPEAPRDAAASGNFSATAAFNDRAGKTTRLSPANLDAFERHLKIYQERGSHVIAVTFTADDADEAARSANRVAELYVERQRDEKRAEVHRVMAWLDTRLPELKKEIDSLQTEMRDYQHSRGMADSDRVGVVDQQLAELNRQLAAAQSDLAARQTQLTNLRTRKGGGGTAEALLGGSEASALSELRRRQVALLQQQADLEATLGDAHPKVQQVRNQLQEVERKINQATSQTAGALANDTDVAAAEVRNIQQRIAAVQSQQADPHRQELERDLASRQHLYDTLQQRRENMREERELITPSVAILSLATAPDRPNRPNALLFLPPASILFLAGGCMLAVLLERLDMKLRSRGDVEEALGIPCLGLVPRLRWTRTRRPHAVLLARPYGAYAEAIRSLFASLGFLDSLGGAKVILVTSSLPEEGKTTLAVSLATYAAMLGRRVLLADLDLRNPAILRELAGRRRERRSDIAVSEQPKAGLIRRIGDLNLDYLAIPRQPADPFACLANADVHRLFRELRRAYDCVVIDSAPVLAVAETRLLTAIADKVLLVVKWGETSREIAQSALRILNGGDGGMLRPQVTGAVVTQVNLRKHTNYHYGEPEEYMARYGKRYRLDGITAKPPALAIARQPAAGSEPQ